MRKKQRLGCQVYHTRSYSSTDCSSSGLPLTPCSIRVYGRFQKILILRNPRLCRYIECTRSGNESVLFILECGPNWLPENIDFSSTQVLEYAFQILQGLKCLHEHGITHHCLDWNSLNLNANGEIQLTNFAVYFSSGGGNLISSPVGNPRFTPPENLRNRSLPHTMSIPELDEDFKMDGPEFDIWCFGLLALEMACNVTLWETLTLKQIFSKLMLLAFHSQTDELCLLTKILKSLNLEDTFNNLHPLLRELITKSVVFDPRNRLSAAKLMGLYPQALFLPYSLLNDVITLGEQNGKCYFANKEKEPVIEFSKKPLAELKSEELVYSRDCQEVWYLWKLSGGSLLREMQKQGLLKQIPPICRFANCISKNGLLIGNETSRIIKTDSRVVILPNDQLNSRVSRTPFEIFLPLLVKAKDVNSGSKSQESSIKFMATNIKEVDIDYQLRRMVIFQRLLRGFPASKKMLRAQALIDIPPVYRGQIWAAMLHYVTSSKYISSIGQLLDDVDFKVSLPSDKQIEVDIPRCHQYHTLLSSPTAHDALRTVIRAWVITNPDLVYWQGLDSLTAPFVCLNFNDAAMAFSCLSQFIERFLYKFFLADNSAVIQEYLACFSQVIAFHDPELFFHLQQQNFSPNLYAMSWYLTMFAHTFPMSKIYHLWDSLMLQNPSFPLFVGTAILRLLRDQLLNTDFDGAILLFSDIPEIEIESIKTLALQMNKLTPPSCTWRNWTNPDFKETQFLPRIPDIPEYPLTEYRLHDRQLDSSPRIFPSDVHTLILLRENNKNETSLDGIVSQNDHQISYKLSKFVIIDIRTKSEFDRGHLPESVSLPLNDMVMNIDEDKLLQTVTEIVTPAAKSLVIVMGSGSNIGPCRYFAGLLIQWGYSRVCSVHGCAEAFAHTNLLIVN